MYLTLITKPDRPAVDLDEVKEFCRVEDDSTDQLLTSFLYAAIEHAESITGRRFVSQQWRLDLDNWDYEIVLPYPNLLTVDSIQYYDIENTQQTLATANYDVYGIGGLGKIREAYGYSFPSVYPRERAIEITFTCGYSDYTEIPEGIKNGIKTIVWYLFENRGEEVNNEFLNFIFGPYIMRGFL